MEVEDELHAGDAAPQSQATRKRRHGTADAGESTPADGKKRARADDADEEDDKENRGSDELPDTKDVEDDGAVWDNEDAQTRGSKSLDKAMKRLMQPARPQQEEEMADEKAESENEEENNDEADTAARISEFEAERSKHAEAGIIERVVMQNFLCHKHLEVSLGPSVNFIHGVNGSGKSAILVAIQTCFGSRASETNRGSSLAQLIKDGENWAKVEVVLKNKGPNAVAEWGDWISLERHIPKSGASTYHIKGPKKSSKLKSDLERIMDHFNIQVTNPCVIMTQDSSREFLQSKEMDAKYNFFLKATLLEQMKIELNTSRKQISEMTQKIIEKVEESQLQKNKLDVLEQDYTQASQLEKLVKEISRLRQDLLWATAQENREVLDAKQAELQTSQKKLVAIEAKVNTHRSNFQLFDERKAALDREVDAARLDTERADAELLVVTEKEKTEQKNIGQQTALRKRVEKARQTAEAAKKEAELRRSQMLEETSRDIESELKQHEAKCLELRQQIDKLQQDEVRMRDALTAMESGSGDVRDQISKLEKLVADNRRQKDEAKTKLQRLTDQQKNRMNVFGGFTTRLQDELRKDSRRFTHPPVGPVGNYIKLRDPAWSDAVEVTLGEGLLKGYVVADKRDVEELQSLFNQLRIPKGEQPNVIHLAHQKEKWDVRARKVSSNSVLDKIDVEDPWVFNTILIEAEPEVWHCENDYHAATDFLERGHNRGTKIKGCINQRGTRFMMNNNLIASRPTRLRDRYLSANTQAETSEFKDRLQHLETEEKVLIRDRKALVDQNARHNDEVRAQQGKLRDIGRSLAKLKEKLAQLEEERPQAPEMNTTEVENEIKTQVDQLQHCNDQLVEIDARVNQSKRVLQELESVKKRHEAAVDDVAKKLEAVESKLHELVESKLSAEEGLARLQATKAKIVAECTARQSEVDDATQAYEHARGTALEIASPERSVDKTSGNIKATIAAYQRQVEVESERFGCTIEEVSRRYFEARREYAQTKSLLKQIEANRVGMLASVKRRMRDWMKFQRIVGQIASQYFNQYLSRQNHSGDIAFDFENKTLKLNVTTNQARTSEDTKSLSGGERSFTTVSFIMALGEAMQAPFRAFDEFDIFMDSINRRVTINTLLEVASTLKNRQFIFITPGDVSMLKVSNDLRLLKLKAPDRNQGVLAFPQANDNADE